MVRRDYIARFPFGEGARETLADLRQRRCTPLGTYLADSWVFRQLPGYLYNAYGLSEGNWQTKLRIICDRAGG